MSPSGKVMTRLVHPVPGPEVEVVTVLAAKSKSGALDVTAGGVLLVAVLPVAEAVTSTGLTGSRPAYSRMRTSASTAGSVKETVTGCALAAAGPMSSGGRRRGQRGDRGDRRKSGCGTDACADRRSVPSQCGDWAFQVRGRGLNDASFSPTKYVLSTEREVALRQSARHAIETQER